jgi:hypothetical protein
LFAAAVSAQAQDSYPSVEVFGGFSYLNADFPNREGLYGWGVSFAGNLTKNIGVVAEGSGNYGHVRIPSVQIGPFNLPGFNIETSVHTFLVGPRFSLRGERWTGFGHVLIGGAKKSAFTGLVVSNGDDEDDDGRLSDPRLIGDTGFAMAVGGGIDLKASRHVAVRLFQVDYLPVRFNEEWTHNFRFQSGIVFRFDFE